MAAAAALSTVAMALAPAAQAAQEAMMVAEVRIEAFYAISTIVVENQD